MTVWRTKGQTYRSFRDDSRDELAEIEDRGLVRLWLFTTLRERTLVLDLT